MTKNKNTYTAKINVADMENNTERFVLTTKSNMTVIIPPLGTLLNEDTGVMEIKITKSSNRITFQATLNKKPVEFEANMEIIIDNLSQNASIVRTYDSGKQVPADYTVEGNRHFIQTNTPGSFQINY
jgi:hypothetical protein